VYHCEILNRSRESSLLAVLLDFEFLSANRNECRPTECKQTNMAGENRIVSVRVCVCVFGIGSEESKFL
jgi:hypothetical protein